MAHVGILQQSQSHVGILQQKAAGFDEAQSSRDSEAGLG